jgi:hypothetical protein
LLFEKHQLMKGWIDEREMSVDRQAAFNTMDRALRGGRPECLISMLAEIAGTQGNLRNRISPRYVYDERWTDLVTCLALDGYRIAGGEFRQVEPAIEGAVAVEDDLTAQLNRSNLREAPEIVRLINSSAEAFRRIPPNLNGCLNDARVAIQTLATAVSRTRAGSRSVGFDETKWGQVLDHLRISGFITQQEEKGLGGVFSFVSPGSHTPVGLSEMEMVRLGRSLGAGMCYFLVTRYNG